MSKVALMPPGKLALVGPPACGSGRGMGIGPSLRNCGGGRLRLATVLDAACCQLAGGSGRGVGAGVLWARSCGMFAFEPVVEGACCHGADGSGRGVGSSAVPLRSWGGAGL